MSEVLDMPNLLNELNDKQCESVVSDAPNILVLAGAGSGKTRVLIKRIAWLVEKKNAVPSSILAVTFTNKAAGEMRQRVEQTIGLSLQHLWMGTFHGIAHRLLRLHWQDAGLRENFQILDSDDQLRLIKKIIRMLEIDEEQYGAKNAQWFINGQKHEGKRAGHLVAHHDHDYAVMIKIYAAYEEACEKANVVDFSELLLRAYELWQKKPELLQHYQQRFKHILVDEFQDTNRIQYAWMSALAGSHNAFFVVGDDDQSIYGWRGACVENIQQFRHDFKDVATFRLEQNYRSTGTILKAANALIENNSDRLGKNLWTDGQDGELIQLYNAYNEQDEAAFVAERIGVWQSDKQRKYSDVVVLYRSNAQSRAFEEAFVRYGIPYRVYGGLRFFERAEIKDALAYLRLVQLSDDDAAFERVVNLPSRGIGERSLQVLRDYSVEHGCSLWQSAKALLSSGQLSSRVKQGLSQFVELIEYYRSFNQQLSLHDLVSGIVRESGLIEHFSREKGGRGQDRIENIEELINAVGRYKVEEENLNPLVEFLSQAALDAGDNEATEHEDSVNLMTIHSVKGLEFPLVFLVGLEEGLFPHQMCLQDEQQLSEERRLCYVAITRAMEMLYISFADKRYQYGQERYRSPSRFIDELPKDTTSQVRLGQSSQNLGYGGGTSSGDFYAGQMVMHKKFGQGIIVMCEGQGDNARLQIKFSVGTKWILADYVSVVG